MRWLIPIAILISACGFPPLEDQRGPGPGPDNCPVPVSYGAPTPTAQEAFLLPGDAQTSDAIEYDSQISASDIVFVYLISPAPQFPNGFVPKTFSITGQETNFATCSGCVVIGAGCQGCAPEVGGTGTFFMATGGSITISAVSPSSVSGTLSNVSFTQVTIANTGATPTFQSTPVSGGCDTRINSLSFTAPVQQP